MAAFKSRFRVLFRCKFNRANPATFSIVRGATSFFRRKFAGRYCSRRVRGSDSAPRGDDASQASEKRKNEPPNPLFSLFGASGSRLPASHLSSASEPRATKERVEGASERS